MKRMNKNDLYEIIFIGRNESFQRIVKNLGIYGYNSGKFGLNWYCTRIHDDFNNLKYDLLLYSRNTPKKAIDIDSILNNIYVKNNDIKSAMLALDIVVETLINRGIIK